MKNFKTIIKTGLCIFALMFVFSAAAYAANGDVAGDIYSTDILAVVNGFPMESYNIGTKTAVIAEDLSEKYYGFRHEYVDSDRTLYVWSWGRVSPDIFVTNAVTRGRPGEIVGNFYETDIKVVFNGYEVAGYNIGGKMAVCIEDLGTLDENAWFGYSKYLCIFTYDNDSRIVTLNSAASFSPEKAAGDIYSTDILAVVNGFPMESYSLEGKTAIIAEDLDELRYGFYCQYNADDKILCVWSGYEAGPSEDVISSVKRDMPGELLGNFYETDIKVLFNDHEVPAYDISGRIAICIEDLGTPDDSENAQYGYSKYLCNFTYNNDTRTVTLDSVRDNFTAVLNEISYKHIRYSFISDNILEVAYDPMVTDNDIEWKYDTSAVERDMIKPLYFSIDGNLTEVGLCYTQRFGGDEFDRNMCMVDFDKANYTVVSQLKREILSYDEAIKLFYESGQYVVKDRCENDKYTVLVVSDSIPDEESEYEKFKMKMIVINKSGGYFKLQDLSDYETVTMNFSDNDTLEWSVYPFTDPHGKPVTLHTKSDLRGYGV